MSRTQAAGDLDRLFNLALDLFCVAGFDGYFKRLSPSWEGTLGFTDVELMSKPYIEFIHPDDRQSTAVAAAKAQAGSRVIQFRNRYLAKDGTYRWLSWNAVPFPEHQMVYAVARDITEIKRREERQSAAYAVTRVLAAAPTLDAAARDILQAVCDGLNWGLGAMWSVDRDAGLIRCIRVWHSPQVQASEFAAITQRSAFPPGIGFPGRVWQDNRAYWLPDIVNDRNFPRADVAMREGLHSAFGFPIRWGSGVIGVIEFFSPEIREPDQDILALFDAIGSQVGQFIERRRTEEKLQVYAMELEAARRLAEESAKAKSDFLANMSHEIRTPMNAIIGMTELALMSNLNRSQYQHLQTVKHAADALMDLLNDILDLSKIEAQKLSLESVDFNIRDTLDETLGLLAIRAAEKGLELACHVSADTPQRVVGDPTRLRQIVVNLAGNAIKFTDKGEVIVRADLEGFRDGRAWLAFEVSDTGIGIPEDKRDLIFEAFSQADSSITRRYGGTGLGLAISSELVRLMNGQISLESTVAKGSKFRVVIPFKVAKGTLRIPEPVTNLDGLRVLGVDDNATNRQILLELLESWKMSPAVAESADAAVETMKLAVREKAPFSLAILDGHMPESDGFALAARLKRNRALAKTKIIMLTSAVNPADAERCDKIRVSAHLNKPVKQSELLEAIVRTFSKRASLKRAPHTVPKEPSMPLRILVAEDNAVNQKLMTELLRRRGHSVKLAANGKEAIELSATGRFDVVLMDIQMPVMDGLEAAASIRRNEKGSNRRIPIIATSAHTVPADRQNALASGMDAYLIKPIRPQELYETVEMLIGRTTPQPIDEQSLLDGVNGSRALLRKLISIFLKDSPRMMRSIRKAVLSRDEKAIASHSHALKGAAGNFGENAVFDTAKHLEQIGKTGRLDAAPAAVNKLEKDLAALSRELERVGK